MTIQLLIILSIVYLGSTLICHVAYVGLSRLMAKQGQFNVPHVMMIKKAEFIPVINSFYAVGILSSYVGGIIQNIFLGRNFSKTKEQQQDIHFAPPSETDPLQQMPKLSYPPLTEPEKKIISLVETIDPDQWIPNINHYYVNIGEVRVVLQQMFNAMPPCYPIYIRIGDNFELRHDTLDAIYRKIDDYYIRKAAQKKVDDLVNREQIMTEIINKLQPQTAV